MKKNILCAEQKQIEFDIPDIDGLSSSAEDSLRKASLKAVPVTRPNGHSSMRNRTFQGIPSIGRAASGRLFAVWYGGGTGENQDNYVMMSISDDNGNTWSRDAVAVIDPPEPRVRAFDSNIWFAPDGKCFWFWTQVYYGSWNHIWDGVGGVWYSILENPNANPNEFIFSTPRRICDGVMMNPPVVLTDKTWVLPVSIWSIPVKHQYTIPKPGAAMWVSTDNGKSFERQGTIPMKEVEGGPIFDEHRIVEFSDGTLHCYLRIWQGVAESVSSDRGKTWSSPEHSRSFTGPNSRFFIGRLKSGRLLLVNNDSRVERPKSFGKRERLTAYLSEDEGKSWPHSLLLDHSSGEVSYPDAVEDENGTIFIIYDRDRYKGGLILMARITEEDIIAGKIVTHDAILEKEISHTRPVPVIKP